MCIKMRNMCMERNPEKRSPTFCHQPRNQLSPTPIRYATKIKGKLLFPFILLHDSTRLCEWYSTAFKRFNKFPPSCFSISLRLFMPRFNIGKDDKLQTDEGLQSWVGGQEKEDKTGRENKITACSKWIVSSRLVSFPVSALIPAGLPLVSPADCPLDYTFRA